MLQSKLVAVDVDGTLTSGNEDLVPAKNVEAIKAIKRNNIPFVIATGREFPVVKGIVEQLKANEANPDYIAIVHGAAIYALDKKTGDYLITDNSSTFESKMLVAIEKKIQELGLAKPKFHLSTIDQHGNNQIYIKDISDWKTLYTQDALLPLQTQVKKLEIPLVGLPIDKGHFNTKTPQADRTIGNVLGYSLDFGVSDPNIETLQKYIRDELHLNATLLGGGSLEVTSTGVNKATALDKILKLHNAKHPGNVISPKNIMFMGDGMNDIEALQFAGNGILLGNANENVKEVAKSLGNMNITTLKNTDGAVGILLANEFDLNEELTKRSDESLANRYDEGDIEKLVKITQNERSIIDLKVAKSIEKMHKDQINPFGTLPPPFNSKNEKYKVDFILPTCTTTNGTIEVLKGTCEKIIEAIEKNDINGRLVVVVNKNANIRDFLDNMTKALRNYPQLDFTILHTTLQGKNNALNFAHQYAKQDQSNLMIMFDDDVKFKDNTLSLMIDRAKKAQQYEFTGGNPLRDEIQYQTEPEKNHAELSSLRRREAGYGLPIGRLMSIQTDAYPVLPNNTTDDNFISIYSHKVGIPQGIIKEAKVAYLASSSFYDWLPREKRIAKTNKELLDLIPEQLRKTKVLLIEPMQNGNTKTFRVPQYEITPNDTGALLHLMYAGQPVRDEKLIKTFNEISDMHVIGSSFRQYDDSQKQKKRTDSDEEWGSDDSSKYGTVSKPNKNKKMKNEDVVNTVKLRFNLTLQPHISRTFYINEELKKHAADDGFKKLLKPRSERAQPKKGIEHSM